ncbi:MAG: zinc-dependent metalloprotease [Gemmatimonadaceae bacterium]
MAARIALAATPQRMTSTPVGGHLLSQQHLAEISMYRSISLIAALGGACLASTACRTVAPAAPTPSPIARSGVANGATEHGAADTGARSGIRPYTAVVPSAAVTRRGLFITQRVGDRLLFEIPRATLNQDMLQIGRLVRAAAERDPSSQDDFGGDQFSERAIRWERVGNRIILRSPSYSIVADSTLAINRAVVAANYPPILATFDVLAYGQDSAAVIDVTRLFTTAVPEFAALRGSVDPARSFIESAVAFPENVEIEATQTVGPTQGQLASTSRVSVLTRSVLAHWSIIRLPVHPMEPRWADDRIGMYSLGPVEFGAADQAVHRRYIARWRLEKKFPDSLVSEPVHPIVYYIDPATPDKWKPWIKKAVEDWQPAFETAGFRHAIIARDAPTNDPDWSAEDIRHTVIRWMPSATENAFSDGTRDVRTGELMNGSIRVFNNITNILRDWYLVQVAPLDPRVQQPQFPDSLMGRMLEYIVSHEVGHTIGLYHNHKASSLYPADSVRSATWVHRMGFTPSVMDYARFDYVAQPEDHIALEDLIPRIGPADVYTIHWGYTPIPGAKTPAEERPTLDAWARQQDGIPWLRFGHETEVGVGGSNVDSGDETEAVGDADPVKSTGFGLLNIRRTVPLLIPMTRRPTEDTTQLAELYTRLIAQWQRELIHVVNVVGGAQVQTKYGSQPGPIYTPNSRARQAAAVRFLNENAFQTPNFLLDPKITWRLEATGSIERISRTQSQILSALLMDARLNRLRDFQASNQPDPYPLSDMLRDVRTGVWSELTERKVDISAERRGLQLDYVARLEARVAPEPAAEKRPAGAPAGAIPLNPDIVSLLRGELVALRADIDAALPRAANHDTRLHLQSVRAGIARILDTREGRS